MELVIEIIQSSKEERVLWTIDIPHKISRVIWVYEKPYELMVVLKENMCLYLT
jgi:hypothetical protein